jgi:FKBP-type peptidyl-prolyl cis-trans isomerase FklB
MDLIFVKLEETLMQRFTRWMMILMVLFFSAGPVSADETNEKSLEKEGIEQQISYALGYNIVDQLKGNFELDPKFFIQGAADNQAGQPKLTPEKLRELLMSFQQMAQQRQMAKMQAESGLNRAAGNKFLEENKKKEGVITLSSGLQYKVLTQGEGAMPAREDTVECHYKGSLIDGTIFDSSYQRGSPAVFQVGGVIPGWIEALQKMKVGSKWQLFIPPDLAYGDRGAGAVIKPGSTLVFEVEVLGIVE